MDNIFKIQGKNWGKVARKNRSKGFLKPVVLPNITENASNQFFTAFSKKKKKKEKLSFKHCFLFFYLESIFFWDNFGTGANSQVLQGYNT